jgi:hypothetical protein
MLHNVPDKEIDDLLRVYYPDDQRAGSPFDTGFLNVLSTVSSSYYGED